ncbi:hypothetical protein DNTS_026136 [Danionella cerebrum]|uniref:C2 domain-containing protein n=1 Tax=Danionella cerebrum TaxID=2873325 RepID=A0A553NAN1_9TELE|nr:hypothetical protein DNTS_026136 [Danionella translucida]
MPPPNHHAIMPPPCHHATMLPPSYQITMPPPNHHVTMPPPNHHATIPPPNHHAIMPPPNHHITMPASSHHVARSHHNTMPPFSYFKTDLHNLGRPRPARSSAPVDQKSDQSALDPVDKSVKKQKRYQWRKTGNVAVDAKDLQRHELNLTPHTILCDLESFKLHKDPSRSMLGKCQCKAFEANPTKAHATQHMPTDGTALQVINERVIMVRQPFGWPAIGSQCQVDLSVLSKECTHRLDVPLEEGEGTLVLLVTLTASAAVSIADLSVNVLDDPHERREILHRYGMRATDAEARLNCFSVGAGFSDLAEAQRCDLLLKSTQPLGARDWFKPVERRIGPPHTLRRAREELIGIESFKYQWKTLHRPNGGRVTYITITSRPSDVMRCAACFGYIIKVEEAYQMCCSTLHTSCVSVCGPERGLSRSFHNIKDVGMVQVKVIRAEGLMAADVTGLQWTGLVSGTGNLGLLMSSDFTLYSCHKAPAHKASLRAPARSRTHRLNRLWIRGVSQQGYGPRNSASSNRELTGDAESKSDPFCVVELSNDRLQTHTVYKNLNPEWNKVFTFNVKDIHSVLEVTVFDEDRDRSADFLGKVAVPLLSMQQPWFRGHTHTLHSAGDFQTDACHVPLPQIQNGERKAYALKSKELTGPTKGVIFLEIDVIYNVVKAGMRTLIPIEQKYIEEEPRVSKQLLLQNFNRVRRCIMFLINTGCFINSCFEWDSPQRSICAFLVKLLDDISKQPRKSHLVEVSLQCCTEMYIYAVLSDTDSCETEEYNSQTPAQRNITALKYRNSHREEETECHDSGMAVQMTELMLFVVVVWNFELYMFPLLLLMLLAWNFLLIASGKDTRQGDMDWEKMRKSEKKSREVLQAFNPAQWYHIFQLCAPVSETAHHLRLAVLSRRLRASP